ncbi:MAG: RNase H-like domain-containing protein [Candidatus Paceibacterota bacterium]
MTPQKSVRSSKEARFISPRVKRVVPTGPSSASDEDAHASETENLGSLSDGASSQGEYTDHSDYSGAEGLTEVGLGDEAQAPTSPPKPTQASPSIVDASSTSASSYGNVPIIWKEKFIADGLSLEDLMILTAEDFRAFYPDLEIKDYILIRGELQKITGARKRSDPLPVEDQPDAKRHSMLVGRLEAIANPSGLFRGSNKKVPTNFPESLTYFDDAAKANPEFWFVAFERTLQALGYDQQQTWLGLLTQAVRKDMVLSTYVRSLMATQAADYATLKGYLINSYLTPVSADKAYESLLHLKMNPGRSIQTAMDYIIAFTSHLHKAGKSPATWPEWHYHFREGLCSPWKTKYLQRVTDAGKDPKDLDEAFLWLTSVGRHIEAEEPIGVSLASASMSSQPRRSEQKLGEAAYLKQPHIVSADEAANRWCAWHERRGHRTNTCTEWRRYVAAWRQGGDALSSQEQDDWLESISRQQLRAADLPAPPPPISEPFQRQPRRVQFDLGHSKCHRCGQTGHIARYCASPLPYAPYGDMSKDPYGQTYRPPSSPAYSGVPGEGVAQGFVHPGSGKKPPLPPLPSSGNRGLRAMPAGPPTPPRINALEVIEPESKDDVIFPYLLRSESNMFEMNEHDLMERRGLYLVQGLVDNHKIQMLIDPGATHSTIASSWVEQHQLRITEEDTRTLRGVVIGEKSKNLLFAGRTADLPVYCEGSNASHSFLVTNLKKGDPTCLVAADLMVKLGYYVSHVRFRLQEAMGLKLSGKVIEPTADDGLRTTACTPHPEQQRVLEHLDELLSEVERVQGFCNLKEAEVEVPIPDGVPAPYVPQYKLPQHSMEKMDLKIQEWIDTGKVVHATDAEGNNPLTAASKRHPVTGERSEVRPCLDIRKVNTILMNLGIKVPNNLPRIKDLFDRLSHKRIVSILDVADAFPSMPVSPKSRRFFRFTWKGRRWEFVGAPFGLLFLSSQFQHLMMTIFRDDMDFVIVFVDDLIVFSDSVDEHIVHLERVLDKLKTSNLRTRKDKCKIGFLEIYMLGHKAGINGIEVDRRKLMSMENWSAPTPSTIEHYLGLFNYFREFIPTYAEVMAPMEGVRKNFTWGAEQQRSWERAKLLLMNAPVLHYPVWDKKFYMATDGSSRAVSAVLFQTTASDEAVLAWIGKGNKFLTMSHKTIPVQIIGFASRATTITEKWYSAYKLELLAVIFGLDRFRNYLLGREFILFTDQRALVWLFKERKDWSTNRAIQTWFDELLEFKFEAIHCPGIRNVLPDVLTRIYAQHSEGGDLKDKPDNTEESYKPRQVSKPMFEPVPSSSSDMERSHDLSPLDEVNWKQLPEQWNEAPKELMSCLRSTLGRIWDIRSPRSRVNGLATVWKNTTYVHLPYEKDEELYKWFFKTSEEAKTGITVVLLLPKRDHTVWYECLKRLAQRYEFSKQNLCLFIVTPSTSSCLKQELKVRVNHMMISEKIMRSVVEDPDEQQRLIREHHDLSHQGTRGVYLSLSDAGYTWPNMLKHISETVQTCTQCQLHTLKREGFHPISFIQSRLPMDHIAIDCAYMPVDAKGYAFILVIVDICTRFVFLRALKELTGMAVGRKLFKLFCEVGFPQIVQSDNGSEFRNSLVAELSRLAEVSHRFTTPYHPRGNGSAESGVKRVKEIIRKKLQGAHALWRDFLPMVQYGANLRVMAVHKSRPFCLFFARGHNPFRDYSQSESHLLTQSGLYERLKFMTELVFPASEEITRHSHEHMRERFLRGAVLTEFPEGSFVVARPDQAKGKLNPRYEGPYKVVRRTRGGTYVLAEGDGTLLRRNYAPDQLRMIKLAEEDLPQTFEVEAIVDCRRTGSGALEYLVKWRGYSAEHNTWQSSDDFQDTEIVTQFHGEMSKLGRTF